MIIPEGDGLRELVSAFTLIELFLDRLAELNVINVSQDEIGFWDFAELFKRLIQRVLLRIGIEPPKKLRGCRLLQLDGGDKSQNLIPLGFDTFQRI
jgi:hypothetical protein